MAVSARQAAYQVLMRCRKNGAWSEDAVSSEIIKCGLDNRDGALCSRIALGVMQNTELLDYYISCYCTTPLKKLDPRLLDILRLSAYQLLFMDKIPVSAAVNEGVSLCKKQVNPKAAGLCNAVLRRIAENRENMPEIPGKPGAAYLAVKYSHPTWMVEELIEQHGCDFAEQALAANNMTPPVYAHSNTLHENVDLMQALACCGAKQSPLAETVILDTTAGMTETDEFHNGDFYIQDMAAKLAAVVGDAKPGMTVLDSCAAPGGKTIATAMLMKNKGRIISCDIHEKKLRLIRENTERLGINIVETRAMDARKPHEDMTEMFDLIIADVPCSGLGVIRRRPEIRRKSEAELDNLPQIQLDILEGLAPCLKKGGTLVYSTCTVRSKENEQLVRRFLAKHEEFTTEAFTLPCGIGEVPAGMMTFWPHIHNTDGFFVSKMRKRT